jgi:sugar/nucleoside kinase (ribokinase family)
MSFDTLNFDTLIIGQVCRDRNTDYDGSISIMPGGAVLYSAHAAAAIGHKVAALPKGASSDYSGVFGAAPNITVFPVASRADTEMINIYYTPDRERRLSRCGSLIDPYRPEDLPDIAAKLYHLAGLVQGDIGEDMITACARRGDTALDAQCVLRRREDDGRLVLHDWAAKREYLPLIRFLKTDAAEAAVLTGLTDRAAAAKVLWSWGAKEIMITHHTEALVYDGETIYTAPLRPRGLAGRTGRGDTIFAAYITERLTRGIADALLFAAGLVSLKMATPGFFRGTRSDVEEFIRLYY